MIFRRGWASAPRRFARVLQRQISRQNTPSLSNNGRCPNRRSEWGISHPATQDRNARARINPQLTADMVRDAVGHRSEAVERGYFAAGDAAKAKVMEVLVDAVKPAERDCKTGVA